MEVRPYTDRYSSFLSVWSRKVVKAFEKGVQFNTRLVACSYCRTSRRNSINAACMLECSMRMSERAR